MLFKSERGQINFQVAPGICTPSNSNLHFGSSSSNGALTPREDSFLNHGDEQKTTLKFSSYRLLAETEDLKLVGVLVSKFFCY